MGSVKAEPSLPLPHTISVILDQVVTRTHQIEPLIVDEIPYDGLLINDWLKHTQCKEPRAGLSKPEQRSGRLVTYSVLPDVVEKFYAVTTKRHFDLPVLTTLLGGLSTGIMRAFGFFWAFLLPTQTKGILV